MSLNNPVLKLKDDVLNEFKDSDIDFSKPQIELIEKMIIRGICKGVMATKQKYGIRDNC